MLYKAIKNQWRPRHNRHDRDTKGTSKTWNLLKVILYQKKSRRPQVQTLHQLNQTHTFLTDTPIPSNLSPYKQRRPKFLLPSWLEPSTPPPPPPPILPFPISLSASTRACECCFAKSNSWASIWLIPAIQPISVSQEAVVYHAGINWDWRSGFRLGSRTDKLSLRLAARDSFTGRKKSSFLILLAKYPIPSCGSDSLKTLSRSGPMKVVCHSLAKASILLWVNCWSTISIITSKYRSFCKRKKNHNSSTPPPIPDILTTTTRAATLPSFSFSSFLRKRSIL